VAHFGALRGRNDFDRFNAVYMTHPHRYEEAYYVGLGLLMHGFGNVPRQWKSKNAWPEFDAIEAHAVDSDLYQDAMRICIRRDPNRRAFIFVPSAKAKYVVRLMRLFRDARVILSDGSVLAEPTAVRPETEFAESTDEGETGESAAQEFLADAVSE